MIDARCRRCGAPAAAIMLFDSSERRLWLEELPADALPPWGIELCAVHAAGRTAPVGWTITDDRPPQRHLFGTSAA